MTVHVGTTWSAQSNHFTAGTPDPDRNNTFRALCRRDVRLYVDDVSTFPQHVSSSNVSTRRWCKLCTNLLPNDPRIPDDPRLHEMRSSAEMAYRMGLLRGRQDRGNQPA